MQVEDPGEADGSRVPAVDRAAAVLDVLRADGQPLRLSELARRLGVAKSSMANLCAAMTRVGWLRRTDRGFALGPRLVEYGQAYLGGLDPVREFHAACDRLGSDLRYTSQMAVLGSEGAVTYVARRHGRQLVGVASEVGQPLPAHCTGAGKALLASLPDEVLERRFAGVGSLPVLTDASISDPAVLRAELERIRERGHAIDDEETLAGVYCLARVLPEVGDIARRAAVSVTLLKAHLDDDVARQAREQLDRLCDDIAAGLGSPAG